MEQFIEFYHAVFTEQMWLISGFSGHDNTQVDHPGRMQGIFSKTGMGYRWIRDDLVRAQGCTHGVYWVIPGLALRPSLVIYKLNAYTLHNWATFW